MGDILKIILKVSFWAFLISLAVSLITMPSLHIGNLTEDFEFLAQVIGQGIGLMRYIVGDALLVGTLLTGLGMLTVSFGVIAFRFVSKKTETL